MTKGQAEDALREHIRGNARPSCAATFRQIGEWYLKTNRERWSKKWRVTVDGLFEHHIFPQLGEKVAADLRKSDIQQAVDAIAAASGLNSKSFLEKIRTQIRAVFSFAVDDELLARNPASKIELPKARKPSQRFLTLEECWRLLSVAGLRDNIIIRLFMVLGLRPGELFALRVDDVQPGALRIDQTVVDYKLADGAKTEDSVADVPMPAQLEADLRRYMAETGVRDLLFPSEANTPISPDNYLDRVLKQLGVAAGIDVFEDPDGTKNSKLNHQILRRTTGTHFQKHGEIKDTQTLLRHTKASTTLDNYQKVIPQSLRDAVQSWDEQLVPAKNFAPTSNL